MGLMGFMRIRPDKQRPQSLSSDLGTIWPGLRYLGLGVWFAWLFLASSGTAWLSDVEIDGSNLSTMYLLSTATCALVLLVAPFCQRFFDALLARRSGVMCGASISTLGAIAIIIAGPYYTGVPPFFLIGSVLMGIGSGVLALKCGQLYGELQPRRALIYALLSQLVLVLIFYFVVGNDFFAPLPGGPSMMGILSLTLLPLLAAYLVTIRPPGTAPQTGRIMEGVPPSQGQSIRTLPAVFWKFIFAVLIFTLATSVAQGYYTTFRLPSATLADTIYVMLFRVVFAAGFLLLAIRFLKNIAFNKLYLLCMVFIAIAFAIAPLLKIDSATFSSFTGFVYSIFDLLVWCLLAFIVFGKRISSTFVFGFGRGVFMAGSAIGWLLGVQVVHSLVGTNWEIVFYVALAFLILLSTTLVFSEKDFDQLFSLSEGKGLPLETLIPDDPAEQSTLSASPSAPTPDAGYRHKRPWLSACRNLGEKGHLSSREQEVLEMLALGRLNENIAQRMNISLNTVRTHTQNVYAKLGIHSRQELVELVESERDTLPVSLRDGE
jgi:DNA-binding CsgD family transcriptional regulator